MGYVLNIREFLNDKEHHWGAYIIARVSEDFQGDPCADLIITDCAHKVSLEFDFESDEGWENSLRKLDILVESITAMKEVLLRFRTDSSRP